MNAEPTMIAGAHGKEDPRGHYAPGSCQTRDPSPRQLPTDHDYDGAPSGPIREYQSDQPSMQPRRPSLARRLLHHTKRRRSCLLDKSFHISVPSLKSVTKFGPVSTALAALLLLGIAPTIPRRRALPTPWIRTRLWQRTSDSGH